MEGRVHFERKTSGVCHTPVLAQPLSSVAAITPPTMSARRRGKRQEMRGIALLCDTVTVDYTKHFSEGGSLLLAPVRPAILLGIAGGGTCPRPVTI